MPPDPNRPVFPLSCLLLGVLLVLGACVGVPLLLAVAGLLVLPVGFPPNAGPPDGQPDTRAAAEPGDPIHANVRFGMPAPVDAQAREAPIERPQYVLVYNGRTLTPNWVCWRLRADDIGDVPRQPFEPDPDLSAGIARVNSDDYDGSGFDRGHMCPAKDRSATEEDSKAVFYMTNIVPQAPNCNQRGWERLEDYCRRLAKEGHVLYIACGPHGTGGEGRDGRAEEVGKRRKITVPHQLWKVVLVLPAEDAEPRTNTRVISVLMPNDQSVGYDWTKYRTTARKIEELTGLTFFRNVPADVAEALRDHRDEVEVRVEQPRGG